LVLRFIPPVCLLGLFLENHRAFLKKGAPKTFLLVFAERKFPCGNNPLVPDAPLPPSELGQGHPKQEAFISCGVNVFALKTHRL
jgi:hypothetical protein